MNHIYRKDIQYPFYEVIGILPKDFGGIVSYRNDPIYGPSITTVVRPGGLTQIITKAVANLNNYLWNEFKEKFIEFRIRKWFSESEYKLIPTRI